MASAEALQTVARLALELSGTQDEHEKLAQEKTELQVKISLMKVRIDEIDARRAILKQAQDGLVDGLRDAIPAKLVAGGGKP